jgi:hypothetical protein
MVFILYFYPNSFFEAVMIEWIRKNCTAIGSFQADLSLKSALVQGITLGWKPDRKSGWRAGIENVVDRIIPIVIS